MSDSTSEDVGSFEEFTQVLFWITLLLGGISGVMGYLILRFIDLLTWYIVAPLLFVVNYAIMYYYLHNRGNPTTVGDKKSLQKFTLKYSGTWIIAYFAVSTAIFYFGW